MYHHVPKKGEKMKKTYQNLRNGKKWGKEEQTSQNLKKNQENQEKTNHWIN